MHLREVLTPFLPSFVSWNDACVSDKEFQLYPQQQTKMFVDIHRRSSPGSAGCRVVLLQVYSSHVQADRRREKVRLKMSGKSKEDSFPRSAKALPTSPERRSWTKATCPRTDVASRSIPFRKLKRRSRTLAKVPWNDPVKSRRRIGSEKGGSAEDRRRSQVHRILRSGGASVGASVSGRDQGNEFCVHERATFGTRL